MAKIVVCMAQGDKEGTKRQVRELDERFSGHEVYIERYYDHFLAMYVIGRFAK